MSIGSAIVGYVQGEEEKDALQDETIQTVIDKELKRNSKEVSISLSFDKIPQVGEESKFESITLQFSNPLSGITINNDKLDLNNLQEVDLRIDGFAGQIDFIGDKLSLSGKAKKIEVNGLAFSSLEDLKISFQNLDYNLMDISNIELKYLQFGQGNGNLNIGEKLHYLLEHDDIEVYYFKGDLTVNENTNTSLLTLGGTTRGVRVSKGLLDFSLW